MDPKTLTVTAATAQATLPPFWTMLQSLTWLHVFVGVSSATVALILRDYKAVWGILTSAKGKAGVVALEEALPVVLKFLALSGHTQAPATIQQINTIVADGNKALGIPTKPPVSAFGLLFALGLLALGAGAHATSFELGTPLTPTAGASYIQATIVTAPDLFKLSGGNLTWEPGAFYGGQVTYQWGKNYGLGLDMGVNVEGAGTAESPALGKLAGGAVVDFLGYVIAVNVANDGWHAGLTYLWGPQTGASVQITP